MTAIELLAYHHWRIARVGAQLATLPSAQLTQHIGGSFGSWAELLAHLVQTQHLWLQRLQGVQHATIPTISASSFAGYVQQWAATAHAADVAYHQIADPNHPITFYSTDGHALRLLPVQMLQHLVDHDSFHTGQLTHALRDQGITPVHTNWLYFFVDQQDA